MPNENPKAGVLNSNPEQDKSTTPGSERITAPLTETEARTFIANEVRRNLWSFFTRFSVILGVANLLGFIGVLAGAYNAAQVTAQAEAERLTGSIDKYERLFESYGELRNKKDVLENDLQQVNDNLQTLKNSRPDQIAQVVTKLNDEAKSYLSQVAALLNTKIYTYGVKSIPTAIYYHGNSSNKSNEFEANNFTLEGNRQPFDPKLPPGSEIVDAWAVPIQELSSISQFYRFSIEKNEQDPTKLDFLLAGTQANSASPSRVGIKIMILYRQKIGLVDAPN